MKRLRIILSIVMIYMLLPLAVVGAEGFSERAASLAEVTAVRTSTSADKIRIVIDATRDVTIKKMVLSSPDRVVVDIESAWVSPKVKKDQGIENRFVGSVRIAQFNPTTVRVVVQTKVGKNNYNVFTLKKPGRVVMDFGNIAASSDNAKIKLPDTTTTKPATKPATKPEPAKTETPKTTPKTEMPKVDTKKSDTKKSDTKKDDTKKSDTKKSDTKKTDKAQPKDESQSAIEEAAGSGDDELDSITGMKGRIITIDAGHGGSDSGAIGPTGVMEKSVTLRIANELKRLLVQEGATVYMTRETDTEVSPKKDKASDIEELQARCDVANESKSDVFISIHTDSFSNGAAKGTTGYYYALGSKKSRDLADKVRSALIDQIETQSRGTQSCNFYVVKHTDMPATLVEVAFISNETEEKLLSSEEGVKKAAQGIADGIADFFG